jgi:hypothetical protein
MNRNYAQSPDYEREVAEPWSPSVVAQRVRELLKDALPYTKEFTERDIRIATAAVQKIIILAREAETIRMRSVMPAPASDIKALTMKQLMDELGGRLGDGDVAVMCNQKTLKLAGHDWVHVLNTVVSGQKTSAAPPFIPVEPTWPGWQPSRPFRSMLTMPQMEAAPASEPMPVNHGKPWSFGDDVRLAVKYRLGAHLQGLAAAFQRHEDAILARLSRLNGFGIFCLAREDFSTEHRWYAALKHRFFGQHQTCGPLAVRQSFFSGPPDVRGVQKRFVRALQEAVNQVPRCTR